jgi:hypothetical protein
MYGPDFAKQNAVSPIGFFVQSPCGADGPFPQKQLLHSFSYGCAERGIAVHDGNTDLDLGDLSVEVPCYEALP